MLILEILKWIGIVLLYLLLAILIILVLVLFLPIKYRGEGTYNANQQYAKLKARWFWGLLRVKVTYPEKPYLSVKILWIELIKQKQEKKEERDAEAPTENAPKSVSVPETEEIPKTEAAGPESEMQKTTQPHKEASMQDTPSEEKEPFYQKWIGIKEKIQYYITILTEQDTKDLITHCKKRILKILKSIRPRKLNVHAEVGFASPDTTGYLYGGYCMISSYLGKNVILIPDFEQKIMDIKGSFKGRITVFVLAWNALRIYLDKRLMRLIAKLKKGGR